MLLRTRGAVVLIQRYNIVVLTAKFEKLSAYINLRWQCHRYHWNGNIIVNLTTSWAMSDEISPIENFTMLDPFNIHNAPNLRWNPSLPNVFRPQLLFWSSGSTLWYVHLCGIWQLDIHLTLGWNSSLPVHWSQQKRELTHWDLVTRICVSTTNQHRFRICLVAWSGPSHYMNQCYHTVN